MCTGFNNRSETGNGLIEGPKFNGKGNLGSMYKNRFHQAFSNTEVIYRYSGGKF